MKSSENLRDSTISLLSNSERKMSILIQLNEMSYSTWPLSRLILFKILFLQNSKLWIVQRNLPRKSFFSKSKSTNLKMLIQKQTLKWWYNLEMQKSSETCLPKWKQTLSFTTSPEQLLTSLKSTELMSLCKQKWSKCTFSLRRDLVRRHLKRNLNTPITSSLIKQLN